MDSMTIVAGLSITVCFLLCTLISFLVLALIKIARQFQGTLYQLSRAHADALQSMKALDGGVEGHRAWVAQHRHRGLSPLAPEDGNDLDLQTVSKRASDQGSLVVSAGFPEPEEGDTR